MTRSRAHPQILEFVRLFNREEFFDAHEVLEDLWQEYSGPDRDLYQGLIQVAVALEHSSRGNPKGARGVLESARRRLAPYLPGASGFDLEDLLKETARFLDDEGGKPPRLPDPTGE